MDLASINRYNFNTSDVHAFHRNDVKKYIANEQNNFDDDYFWLTRYDKPVIFSESGATELWECDNHVETRRNIWQNAFWGIAGALDWEIEQLYKHPNATPKVWSIYERVAEFFDGVDLDGGNWHSGITELDDGNLEYNSSYRDDCIRDDELADVVYLRSGDKERAFGVITNRRANYFTLGEGKCIDSTTALPQHSDSHDSLFNLPVLPDEAWFTHLLRNYGSVEHNMNDFGDLRIRNMDMNVIFPREFKIKYYSPYDQNNSIKEETRWSPILKLEHPDLDTLDIVLFEVFPMGENFKNASNDTTTPFDSLNRKQKIESVKIYPNPNDGSFVIIIEDFEKVKSIQINDNLGKRIDVIFQVLQENHYSNPNLKSGVYIVEVVFKDEIIRKKIVVN